MNAVIRTRSKAGTAGGLATSRPQLLAALTVCAIALLGCVDGTTFETTQVGGDYRTAGFGYVAGGRDFHTVVRGNPFGGDDEVGLVWRENRLTWLLKPIMKGLRRSCRKTAV